VQYNIIVKFLIMGCGCKKKKPVLKPVNQSNTQTTNTQTSNTGN